MECHIHKIPMDWIEDVMCYLDKYGCLFDPCDAISMMSPNFQKGAAAH